MKPGDFALFLMVMLAAMFWLFMSGLKLLVFFKVFGGMS